MEYTLGIVFNNELSRVLLLETNHGPYPNHINGIGGKIEITDTGALGCMIREAEEELERPISMNHLEVIDIFWLQTVKFPSGVILHVYAVVAKVYQYETYSTPEGELMWFPVDHDIVCDVRNSQLAGEGNVAYFINAGRLFVKEYREWKESLNESVGNSVR